MAAGNIRVTPEQLQSISGAAELRCVEHRADQPAAAVAGRAARLGLGGVAQARFHELWASGTVLAGHPAGSARDLAADDPGHRPTTPTPSRRSPAASTARGSAAGAGSGHAARAASSPRSRDEGGLDQARLRRRGARAGRGPPAAGGARRPPSSVALVGAAAHEQPGRAQLEQALVEALEAPTWTCRPRGARARRCKPTSRPWASRSISAAQRVLGGARHEVVVVHQQVVARARPAGPAQQLLARRVGARQPAPPARRAARPRSRPPSRRWRRRRARAGSSDRSIRPRR